MGEFRISFNGGPDLVLPNRFHREGALALWQRAFLGGQAPTFWLGISGITVADSRDARPNHTGRDQPTPAYLDLDRETTKADLQEAMSNDGGCANSDHAYLCGIPDYRGRQAVTFECSTNAGGAKIVTGTSITIANAFSWTLRANPEIGPGYWIKDDALSPDAHGYPWCTPTMYRGVLDARSSGWGRVTQSVDLLGDPEPGHYFFDPALSPAEIGWKLYILGSPYEIEAGNGSRPGTPFADPGDGVDTQDRHWGCCRPDTDTLLQIEDDAWRGGLLPVRTAYLLAGTSLLASAQFVDDLRLQPGASIRLGYEARVRQWQSVIDTDEVY